jgi:flavin-dependent thymidylate synthase
MSNEPVHQIHPDAYVNGELICRRCDFVVGFGAAGVVKPPEDKDHAWLSTHCWGCHRSQAEVERDPRGTESNQAAQETSKEISRWADQAMFEATPMKTKRPSVYLLWATPDPLGAIAAACRMYEGKPTYDLLADISREERLHYWEQVQQTHLKAPLEFVKFHFFIEAVDRSFTHQMVRQRTAVFAQESLRFAVKENLAQEVIVPPSLITDDDINKGIFEDTIQHIEEAYEALVDRGVPAEDARALLPHCVSTRLNYCTDLRNLLEHAGNRLCTQAQFIWREVFIQLVKAIDEYNAPTMLPQKYRTHFPYADGTNDGPMMVDVDHVLRPGETHWQFGHIARSNIFKPVCFSQGKCPFMAVFDRQCTIRERVNKGEFDKIKPEEYMADATAGRRD